MNAHANVPDTGRSARIPEAAPGPEPPSAALFRHVRNGDADGIRSAVAAGAGPDTPGLFGTTPLLAAVAGASLPAIRALVAAGADPDAPGRNASGRGAGRFGPLHLAAARDDIDAVRLLLELGADAGRRAWLRSRLICGIRCDQVRAFLCDAAPHPFLCRNAAWPAAIASSADSRRGRDLQAAGAPFGPSIREIGRQRLKADSGAEGRHSPENGQDRELETGRSVDLVLDRAHQDARDRREGDACGASGPGGGQQKEGSGRTGPGSARPAGGRAGRPRHWLPPSNPPPSLTRAQPLPPMNRK